MRIKILFSVLALTLTLSAFSQKSTFELVFTANNDEQYVPLGSIFVNNLTQACDTILYWPDTVLVLDYNSSISNNNFIDNNSFYVSQNYPNPFEGKTEVILHLAKKEHITITVHNIFGKELVRYENIITRGNHTFLFYSGNEGYCFFTVDGEQNTKTIKMLNIASNTTKGGKCKLVYNGYDDNMIRFKVQKSTDNFIFAPGDTLRIIGYAKTVNQINGSDVIEDSPLESSNYEFQIIEGLPCGTPIMTDADGNVYNTVQIGGQCWMKENLRVGIRIDGSQEMTNNSIIEKYCRYNDSASCEIYGGLYQWDEMMQYTITQGAQGICPNGWHLPTHDEWTILFDFLGGEATAGGKMKETGTTHWISPNVAATNSSGFTALPGGYRHSDGLFSFLGGYWWSSSEFAGTQAWDVHLRCTDGFVYRYHFHKTLGFRVRCLKD